MKIKHSRLLDLFKNNLTFSQIRNSVWWFLMLLPRVCDKQTRRRWARAVPVRGGGLTGISPTAASPEERARGCVAWDRERRLSFAVPFVDMKPIIHLDLFLPRVTELALSAGDRHTKVLTHHSPRSATCSLGDMCCVSWALCFL